MTHVPLSDVDINYVETIDDAFEFKRWLGNRRPVLSADLETTGFRWWLPGFRIRLAQFGDANSCWVFRPDRWGSLLDETLRTYEGQMCGTNFVGFDIHCLEAGGFALPNRRKFDDTLLMSRVAESYQFDHSLKGWARRNLGPEWGFGQDELHKAFEAHGLRYDGNQEESEYAWSMIPYDCVAYKVYSGLDTVLDARRWEALNPVVQREFKQAYEREMGSWWVTRDAEHRGNRVDLAWANQMHDELEAQIKKVYTQLCALGLPEPRRRKNLIKKLVEEGWTPEEFSPKSGDPSTKKAIIQDLPFEVIGPLMEYNRLEHWKVAYVESVLKSEYNGRVYPKVNPMQAKTGREAMSRPPLHQIPKRHTDAWKMRRMFLPNEGEKCVSIDYQAQENRLTAHYSQDPLLLKILNEGLDIHRYTAAAIFNTRLEDVTEEQRDTTKTYSYASAYGAQDLKLSSVLGVHPSAMPEIRERVAGAFTGVAKYSKDLEQQMLDMDRRGERPFVWTLGGRRVYIDRYEGGRIKTTQIVNAPNQGTGADLLKEAKNRTAAAELDHRWMFGLHDEGLFSLPPGKEGEDEKRALAELMSFKKGDTVFGEPLRVDFPTSCGELEDFWGSH